MKTTVLLGIVLFTIIASIIVWNASHSNFAYDQKISPNQTSHGRYPRPPTITQHIPLTRHRAPQLGSPCECMRTSNSSKGFCGMCVGPAGNKTALGCPSSYGGNKGCETNCSRLRFHSRHCDWCNDPSCRYDQAATFTHSRSPDWNK